jgi:hypothetical protein
VEGREGGRGMGGRQLLLCDTVVYCYHYYVSSYLYYV